MTASSSSTISSEKKQNRPKYEVADIIRGWGDEFLSRHDVVPQVRKSFARMTLCRTSALGGHIEQCPECGEIHISYNSCRDRHCPKCQNKERELWVEMRREEVLPGVKYFHVVFTIPDSLHPVAMPNQALFYGCMFKAAWATLRKFFESKGLQEGMTSVLHTWGSNLYFHPHIHCIVPGGGMDADGVWHGLQSCKKSDFLFPVQAQSSMFRGKMMSMLTKVLAKAGKPAIKEHLRCKCFKKTWVVYSRPPAMGVKQVLEYIGRYAYRVAISNSRIKEITPEGKVTYDWKDYKHGGRHKDMTVMADTFLHLFSLHILPPAFVRIRHYGLLSPSNRDKLRKAQVQLGATPVPKYRKQKPYLQISEEKGWGIGWCKCCGCRMVVIDSFDRARSPPLHSLRLTTKHA